MHTISLNIILDYFNSEGPYKIYVYQKACLESLSICIPNPLFEYTKVQESTNMYNRTNAIIYKIIILEVSSTSLDLDLRL